MTAPGMDLENAAMVNPFQGHKIHDMKTRFDDVHRDLRAGKVARLKVKVALPCVGGSSGRIKFSPALAGPVPYLYVFPPTLEQGFEVSQYHYLMLIDCQRQRIKCAHR